MKYFMARAAGQVYDYSIFAFVNETDSNSYFIDVPGRLWKIISL